MDPEDFHDLVERAMAGLPGDLAAHMTNVVIVVDDEPPPDDPDLLGLYSGVPLTHRGDGYAGALPDQITIFRMPLLAQCDSVAELIDEVRITVVHEIAHHFGIDDTRLAELGYD